MRGRRGGRGGVSNLLSLLSLFCFVFFLLAGWLAMIDDFVYTWSTLYNTGHVQFNAVCYATW